MEARSADTLAEVIPLFTAAADDPRLATAPRVADVVRTAYCLTAGTPCRAALRELEKQGFSRAPVLRGKQLLGVFSSRLFARSAAKVTDGKITLGNLPVDDLTEQPPYLNLETDLAEAYETLRKTSYALTHDADHPGIITRADVVEHLYRSARPFVALADIETTLRNLFLACGEPVLAQCATRALAGKYTRGIPRLTEMTFHDYVCLVQSRENWELLKPVFASQREWWVNNLTKAAELRNRVFHFRGTLDEDELQDLNDVRNFVLAKARQSDGAGGA